MTQVAGSRVCASAFHWSGLAEPHHAMCALISLFHDSPVKPHLRWRLSCCCLTAVLAYQSHVFWAWLGLAAPTTTVPAIAANITYLEALSREMRRIGEALCLNCCRGQGKASKSDPAALGSYYGVWAECTLNGLRRFIVAPSDAHKHPARPPRLPTSNRALFACAFGCPQASGASPSVAHKQPRSFARASVAHKQPRSFARASVAHKQPRDAPANRARSGFDPRRPVSDATTVGAGSP